MQIPGRPGEVVPHELLEDIPRLIADYYTVRPDPSDPREAVAFGTSGHRGSSLDGTFTESHVVAISQAIVEHRRAEDHRGPIILGRDTHALSEAAHRSVVEVCAGNGVEVRIQSGGGFTPTPVVSRTILRHNRESPEAVADGIILTPSHNPPRDGGLKYNPPSGGPAGTGTTRAIQERANELLRNGNAGVRRIPWPRALRAGTTRETDFIHPYVEELGRVVDMEIIRSSGIRLGADPMGGAGLAYWEPIGERYRLDVEVVNTRVDPAFSFMPLDGDLKVRMDCSSPHAMAGLLRLAGKFDLAFGNDPDFDRHGIVTPGGLMNPNHYLAVAVDHLFSNRRLWSPSAGVGKTLVSSAMIDRVAEDRGRRLHEVPVGFKWFVEELREGRCGFGGEESAGASFLCRDGSVWTTDKDGFIMDLLAAEITAASGEDPAVHYRRLEERFGTFHYRRTDVPASAEERRRLGSLGEENVGRGELAGDPVEAVRTRARGNGAPIGGIKVETRGGWFAARPSGTEDIYKVYAESFRSAEHLEDLQREARRTVGAALAVGD